MSSKTRNPARDTATGPDFVKAGGLRDQDTITSDEIKFTLFFACDGGSVERLDLRGVAA